MSKPKHEDIDVAIGCDGNEIRVGDFVWYAYSRGASAPELKLARVFRLYNVPSPRYPQNHRATLERPLWNGVGKVTFDVQDRMIFAFSNDYYLRSSMSLKEFLENKGQIKQV